MDPVSDTGRAAMRCEGAPRHGKQDRLGASAAAAGVAPPPIPSSPHAFLPLAVRCVQAAGEDRGQRGSPLLQHPPPPRARPPVRAESSHSGVSATERACLTCTSCRPLSPPSVLPPCRPLSFTSSWATNLVLRRDSRARPRVLRLSPVRVGGDARLPIKAWNAREEPVKGGGGGEWAPGMAPRVCLPTRGM